MVRDFTGASFSIWIAFLRGLKPFVGQLIIAIIMGQITIYLDEELEKKVRTASEKEKVSRSRWIADVIRQHLNNEWPAAVREAAGSWADFPALEELRAGVEYETRENF